MAKHTISLRIDAQVESELDFIKSKLKLDSSKAIKEAIHSKYIEIVRELEKVSSTEILEASGFIASFNGTPEMSQNYKASNLNSIKKKHAKS